MKDSTISSEKHIFDELAYTVGFFLGDGSLYSGPFISTRNGKTYYHNDVVFGCGDLDAIERVQSQIELVFGKRYNIQHRILNTGSTYYVLSTHRRPIFNFFSVNTAMRTVIPHYYFGASPEVRKELCSGLMDSDGHCMETVLPGGGPRWQLGFSNGNLGLVQDTASIMQKLGVKVGNLTASKKAGFKDVHILHPNARSFYENGFRFHVARKQARLDRYVAHVLGSETLRTTPPTRGEDIVPPCAKA